MAQGKAEEDKIKEKAIAMSMTGDSLSKIARVLRKPKTTVAGWIQKAKKNIKDLEEGTLDKDSDLGRCTNELVQLRTKSKEEFVDKAWNVITKGIELVELKLDRALSAEREIGVILKNIKDTQSISDEDKAQLDRLIADSKSVQIRDLYNLIGTMYDKQALANNENTQNIGVNGTIRFEDMPE